jgi:hypothetical protein
MKKVINSIFAIYIFIAAIFIAIFMITGEIKLKSNCITERGFWTGLFVGCESYNSYVYYFEITKRMAIYSLKGLLFPYFIFELF